MTTDLESDLHSTMTSIGRAWKQNSSAKMRPYLHPQMTMILPGFRGTVTGSDAIIGSFEEFSANAKVLEYQESDELTQIVGDVGFVSFRFNMLYERAAYRERSIGRDIWAFQLIEQKWLAVWRTMVELKEERKQLK